jgi:hypothetical protein
MLKRLLFICVVLLTASCAAIPYFYTKQKFNVKAALIIIDKIAKKHQLETSNVNDSNSPIRIYKGIPHPSFENWHIGKRSIETVLTVISAPSHGYIHIESPEPYLRKEIIDALRKDFGKSSIVIGHDFWVLDQMFGP